MRNPFRNIFITNRIFWLIGIIFTLFALSFSVKILFYVAQAVIVVTILLVLVDYFILFNRRIKLSAERKMSNALSLSDENNVHIIISSKAPISLSLKIIDELPYQLQKRDFELNMEINPGKTLQ
ncbi:MAG: hypothetical protein WAT43_05910, partial [Chitinophagales bacterium]